MRASAELPPHTKRPGLAKRTNRAGFFEHDAKDTGGANTEKAGTHTGTLAGMVVEDLRGLGLTLLWQIYSRCFPCRSRFGSTDTAEGLIE